MVLLLKKGLLILIPENNEGKMITAKCVEELSGSRFNDFIKKDVVVVDFFAEWCMPCLMMAPVFEELCNKIKKIKFGKVNVDDNSALSSKFNVMSIPTLIVFKNGKEIDRFVGGMQPEQLEERLSKFI